MGFFHHNLTGVYIVDAMTTKQATKNLEQLIEHVILDVEPTIICNENGQKAVLIGFDEFNAWQETFYLLSNPANAAHLFKSIQEIEAGESFEKQLIEL
jgi:antitoxin YefM